MSEGKWQWWAGRNEEHFSVGPCDTREQAVEAAQTDFDGEGFYITEARQDPIDIKRHVHMPEVVEGLIQRANESAAEYENEDGDAIFDPSADEEKDLVEILTLAFGAWVAKHNITGKPYTFTAQRNDEFVPGTEPAAE